MTLFPKNPMSTNDHTATLLRITETLGRVDARTASMEAQAANDRIENREAHKALGIRIDLLALRVDGLESGRIEPLEQRQQDARITMRNVRWAYGSLAGIAAVTWAVAGDAIKAALGY